MRWGGLETAWLLDLSEGAVSPPTSATDGRGWTDNHLSPFSLRRWPLGVLILPRKDLVLSGLGESGPTVPWREVEALGSHPRVASGPLLHTLHVWFLGTACTHKERLSAGVHSRQCQHLVFPPPDTQMPCQTCVGRSVGGEVLGGSGDGKPPP